MDPLVRRGIELFNKGEFFACHEVLEEAWTPERGPRRLFLQSVIHVAVGFYHCQRGNPVGARRQLGKALRKLAPYLPACESIDTARLYADAQAVAALVDAGSEVLEFPRIHLHVTAAPSRSTPPSPHPCS
jgi:predicted metal-dependent hydrolase